MLRLTTLASGSEGNCLLAVGGDSAVLIDAGISCRRILSGLAAAGLSPAALTAVLVTHEHSDHISGLPVLAGRLGLPVYASRGTAAALARRAPFAAGQLRAFPSGGSFALGSLEIRSFPTSHDAADSVGYRISRGSAALAVATDLGVVTSAVLDGVLGCQALVVETNHDPELLRTGPYPYPLKQRILGPRGHLCNADGAALAVRVMEAGARSITLAHLSLRNNTPELALAAVRECMAASGFDPEGSGVTVTVAPRSSPGRPCSLGEEAAVC